MRRRFTYPDYGAGHYATWFEDPGPKPLSILHRCGRPRTADPDYTTPLTDLAAGIGLEPDQELNFDRLPRARRIHRAGRGFVWGAP